VLVGWRPCECASALENFGGHTVYRCRTCADRNVSTICYTPWHVRTAADVLAEAEWLRTSLAVAERALETLAAGPRRDGVERGAAGLRRAIRDKEVSAAGRR
jgi:hypothetical protein